MKRLNIEDYLQLLKSVEEKEYGADNSNIDQIPKDSWIWAESPHKDKLKSAINNKVIDCLNLSKNEIREAILKNSNIKIGEFLIKIHSRENSYNVNFSFKIHKKQYRTMNGFPCDMEIPAKLNLDERFIGKPWMNLFENDYASNIPIDTFVEIAKWIQIIQTQTLFL